MVGDNSVSSETHFFTFFCTSEPSGDRPTDFLSFPRPRKRHFSHFSLIRGLGNVIFRIFHSSEASETSFFAFFAHPRPRKRHFSHFPLIRGLGNVIFRIFHSSEASETSFFAFFTHPSPRIKQKPRNLALTTRGENGKSRLAACGKQSPYALGRCGAWGRI